MHTAFLRRRLLRAVGIAIVTLTAAATSARGQNDGATFTVLNRDGKPVKTLVDGNAIRAVAALPEAATSDVRVAFRLSDSTQPAADCVIRAGARSCESAVIDTLGWYWSAADPASPRTLRAEFQGTGDALTATLAVQPRPVVLVHGFNSSHATWQAYVGADGFLARLGLHGYAVGDGQAPGALNTGDATAPRSRTLSIAQNAALLAGYVDEVRRLTGAEKIDLVAHSMGGLISRAYIDRFARDGGVAQLLTLGTPMAGTACAVLPASLGLMLPASIEIQPSYVEGIFNPQITRRNGSVFRLLAGTPLLAAVQSPCASVPSDLVVSADSVRAINADVHEMPALHTNMTSAREVFDEFVAVQLKTPRDAWTKQTDAINAPAAAVASQFSKVYTGHIARGGEAEVVIEIEPDVAVATFALYDTSRTLDVVVTGASGKTIQLDVKKNGFVRVEDPSTMLYLGYGFVKPKPGKWRVRIVSTAQTPAGGAEYAITAQLQGGAQLAAETDATVVQQGERVAVRARLTRDGAPIDMQSARVVLRDPQGITTTMNMAIDGANASLQFVPTQSGLHAVDVEVVGKTSAGAAIDRAAFLAVDVEPSTSMPWRGIFTAMAAVLIIAIVGAVIVVAVRRRRRR